MNTSSQENHRAAASKTLRQENPFRVLGVAMIVDQRGIGARLVARYPIQPSTPMKHKEPGHDDTPHVHDEDHSNDDLFFTLT